MAYIHVYECRTSLPLIASVTRNGREHRSQVWNVVGLPTMGAAVQCYSHARNSDHPLVWTLQKTHFFGGRGPRQNCAVFASQDASPVDVCVARRAGFVFHAGPCSRSRPPLPDAHVPWYVSILHPYQCNMHQMNSHKSDEGRNP